MNKFILFFSVLFLFSSIVADAKPVSANSHLHRHYHSSSSSSNYLIKTDFIRESHSFPNCDKHSFIKETTINYYSNGSKRAYSYYTILNSNGTVLASDCLDVDHIINNDKHCFIIKNGRSYKIINDIGDVISNRNYSKLSKISNNRILAKFDKKYGIIDMNENIIVPLKYKSFDEVRNNLFLSNLNGYFGLVDSENNILIHNDFDKITQLYDTFLLKKKGKCGLANSKAEIIIPVENDSIKKLGEYILVKNDNLYSVLDSQGNLISNKKFKKIKLDRNVLKGKNRSNKWVEIISYI